MSVSTIESSEKKERGESPLQKLVSNPPVFTPYSENTASTKKSGDPLPHSDHSLMAMPTYAQKTGSELNVAEMISSESVYKESLEIKKQLV